MKIRQEDNLILTNGNNEKKFTIQASAKAFQILSSALYSRKVEAIIRELSCNAFDSHMMAGYPERPFTVHLPNEWAPEFYVEDFGIGLSADDVENIYTSYFTSTKTESNDVIGGLGLGSKTPFSYTDSFNIRTRKGGIECHYNAYINMAGEPSVSLLSSTPTTEPNGVRVTVPVKVSDFDQFAQDANVVYKWFPVLPQIVGRELTISNTNAVRLAQEGSFWAEYGKGSYNKNIIYAVMGNVCYHVPNVAETFSSHFSVGEQTFFKNNSLYVKFDIGDLDVAASRETISFDEETEKVFIKRVQDVIRLFSQETQDKLDGEITNVVDAIQLVQNTVGIWAHDMFTYNGETIQKWGSRSFVEWMFKHEDDEGNSWFENYNFARNNRGQVKRNSLDYTSYHTFTRLSTKKIIVLMGDDKGYQRVARQLADYGVYGVYFTIKQLPQSMMDELVGLFGENIKFLKAADVVEDDRLKRKAERDAAKALQGPTERKVASNRITKEELRCRLFHVKDPTYGYPRFNVDAVITADDMLLHKYAIVADWYSEGEITTSVMDDNGKEITVTVATNSEAGMYNICRALGLDALIIVKKETLNKAQRLFGDNVTEVTAFDEDFLSAAATLGSLSYWDECTVEGLLQSALSSSGGYVYDLTIKEAEKYIQDNPDCELVKFTESAKSLSSVTNWDTLPHNIKRTYSAYKPRVVDIKASINAITEAIRNRYPMLFEPNDIYNVRRYIQLVDSVESAKEVVVPVVEEE